MRVWRRIWRMLPGGPVLSERGRAPFVERPPDSGVRDLEPPRVPFPVLPFQVWGAHYALDLVLISKHPDWTMHELARIDLPDGPLWLAKDADTEDAQFVIADLDRIESWLPEIPVPRRREPLEVTDRSAGRKVDVSVRYVNQAGESVEIDFVGKLPGKPPARRNGSTMGHSRQAVAAVLDLAGQTQGGQARVQIGGREWGVERLLGFYRMQFVLEQGQGGLTVTSFRQAGAGSGFRLTRPAETDAWPTRAEESWSDDGERVVREGLATRLCYRFAPGESRELLGASVIQAGRSAPVLSIRLDRALPDLRRPFEGEATSRFLLDVNGQQAHGTGELVARWSAEGPEVLIRPTEPWWLADRPMRTEIRFAGGGATVRTARLD